MVEYNDARCSRDGFDQTRHLRVVDRLELRGVEEIADFGAMIDQHKTVLVQGELTDQDSRVLDAHKALFGFSRTPANDLSVFESLVDRLGPGIDGVADFCRDARGVDARA